MLAYHMYLWYSPIVLFCTFFIKCLDISLITNITMDNSLYSINSVRSREGLLETVYSCLEGDTSLDTIHIPHSDVFFVREALEDRFNCSLSLSQVEEYMKEAGWRDSGDT